MEPTSSAGGNSPAMDAAIERFKGVQEEATMKKLNIACDITEINGEANAIKAISPA
jgi:hypothetical protein